ncbi:MAG: Gfo/Idh/MocA family oxidoreductase [Lentisphaerota bacterium]
MHGMLLIGCGNMAKHGHCPQLKNLENLKLVSACDVSVEKAEAFKNEFGFTRFSGDYKSELVKNDIDVVLVATTWQPRFQIIKDCLLAGKHVLAEKPLTLYLDEIDELIKISKENNVRLRVGYIQRASPMMNKVWELIKAGTIGTPKSLTLIHHQQGLNSDWATIRNLLRGGVTPGIDCGIHICDVARWWFDDEPESVFSTGCRLANDIESNTLTHDSFVMKKGVKVFLEECYSNNTNGFARMQILGDKGGIFPVWARNGINEHIILWDGINHQEQRIDFQAKGKSTGEQMKKFLTEIENNIDTSQHLEDVRKSTEMTLGALLSSARNEVVKFPLSQDDIREVSKLITRDK